jgi:hypothetical protein
MLKVLSWKRAAVLSHNVAELNLSVSTVSTYLGLQGRGSPVASGAVHLVPEELRVIAAGAGRSTHRSSVGFKNVKVKVKCKFHLRTGHEGPEAE